jgi:eight-cysteine-cluster-containing protein
MQRIHRFLSPCLVVAWAGFAFVACGDSSNVDDPGSVDTSVQARRLSDGTLKRFNSEDAVPGGWIPCTDARCLIPPTVPCQNVGPTACVLQPECNLRTLACWQEGRFVNPATGVEAEGYTTDDAVEMSSMEQMAGEASASGTTGGAASELSDPLPYPGAGQRCVVTCEHKRRFRCSDIKDPKVCAVNPKCEWQQAPICEIACNGDDCPPCAIPRGICVDKKPEPLPCTELDKRQCASRGDCEWKPGYCPAICTYPDCDGPICKPFCQPKKDDPVCPPVPAIGCAPGFEPVYEKDENGCVVDMRCEPVEPKECKATGCSGQICAAEDVASTCEWLDYYQCYKLATCEAQANGDCGWTPNDAFEACMKEHGGSDPICPTDCAAYCSGDFPSGCANPGCRCPEPKPDSCELEYALQCPDGQVDGCLTGETNVHRCVPKKVECRRGGCSNQLCVGPDGPLFSTCEWADYYRCYDLATCEQQADGACGWTPNDKFDACMKDNGARQD